MSNIQKQHKISPAIAWLTIQKFIIFYCPLDGEHTIPLKQYSSFSLYLFKAFRPKTSLFGEGMWESNPPRTLLTPHTGFEDQETHQLSIYPHILIIPIKLIHYSKLPLTFQVFSYIIFLKKTELHTRLWSGLSTKEEY